MAKAADRAKSPARTSVWLEGKALRNGAGRRSDQPSGLDRERITEATVRLLDEEGLAKFSMRRLAADLNVTAMSVYWYVDTKDDLLELALDAAAGEMNLPDVDSITPDGWRETLRELAEEYRRLLVRHAWVSPLVGNFLNIGPNWLRFALTVQNVVRKTGLPAKKQTGAISAVFQFVYGFGTVQGHYIARCAAAGLTPGEYFTEAMAVVRDHPDVEETLHSAADMMEARGGATVEEMWELDFTVALDLLIAGIEATLKPGP
ncbi:TetR family transcriptional regulator [Streptomyces longisporoflavus]|uniref:TetR/AcrR family transcriptional regulator n=1 Tax=Streptomyces longisporoflavus TaxID=28044 RepID=UPI00167CB753|nr:TetR/AcrR family transcriptional regulator [Streptomyces longisporoflavus]GGV49129.1 TetR family transcriptional regulator [Streptomyces longisporoflavus]